MSYVSPLNDYGDKRFTLGNRLTNCSPVGPGVVMSNSRPDSSETWVLERPSRHEVSR